MIKSVLLTTIVAVGLAACAPQGRVSTSSLNAVDSLSQNMSQADQELAQDVAQNLGNPELTVTPVASNSNAININIAGMTLPVEFVNDGKFAVKLAGIPLTFEDLKNTVKMESVIFDLLFNSGPKKATKTAEPKFFQALLPIFYRLIIDAILNYVSSQVGVNIPNPIATTPGIPSIPAIPTLPTTGNGLVDTVFQLIGGLFSKN